MGQSLRNADSKKNVRNKEGPSTKTNLRPNGADRFTEHHDECEARGKPSADKTSIHQHNNYPKLREMLRKRRSLVKLAILNCEENGDAFDPICNECLQHASLRELHKMATTSKRKTNRSSKTHHGVTKAKHRSASVCKLTRGCQTIISLRNKTILAVSVEAGSQTADRRRETHDVDRDGSVGSFHSFSSHLGDEPMVVSSSHRIDDYTSHN